MRIANDARSSCHTARAWSLAWKMGRRSAQVSSLPKVLPILPEREGSRVVVRMQEPIDPTEFRDVRTLRGAIAAVFAKLILEKPWNVDYGWYPSPLVTEVPPADAD